MEITVLAFAGLKEKLGFEKRQLSLPEASRAGDVFAELFSGADAATIGRSVMLAINRSYVKGDAILRHGDELALIPPVAGG